MIAFSTLCSMSSVTFGVHLEPILHYAFYADRIYEPFPALVHTRPCHRSGGCVFSLMGISMVHQPFSLMSPWWQLVAMPMISSEHERIHVVVLQRNYFCQGRSRYLELACNSMSHAMSVMSAIFSMHRSLHIVPCHASHCPIDACCANIQTYDHVATFLSLSSRE
mmetsp:Transcript_190/g.278  ORF Transcript_190/g.278 Transcript_190/m.278 type:complete len:165 (-) Transcript_190:125-619(-)|eukprot:scaffold179088_cov44-Tisochrysis_lutea.AAC.1